MKRFSTILAVLGILFASPALAQSSAQPVQGPTATGAAQQGNPVPIGCVYTTTLPILTDGVGAQAQCGTRGSINAQLRGVDSVGGMQTSASNSDGTAVSSVNGVYGLNLVFNGTTVDRMRGDTNGAVMQPALSSTFWGYAAVAGGIVSSTADVAVKAAAGASVRNYLCTIDISHDLLSAATEVVAKDGATVIWRSRLQTPATDISGGAGKITFNPCLRGTVNTAVNVALITSVTGGVYVNATGYTGS